MEKERPKPCSSVIYDLPQIRFKQMHVILPQLAPGGVDCEVPSVVCLVLGIPGEVHRLPAEFPR